MPTYHLTTLRIIDREKFREYATKARPLLEQYGGEYLAAGRAAGSLEGEAIAGPLVLTKWADTKALTKFWNSEEYRGLRDYRSGAVLVDSTIIES